MDNNIKIKNSNPNEHANVFSKLTFTWIMKLLYKGTKQDLGINDLYDNLPSDKSDRLCNALEENWVNELKNAKEHNSKPSLFTAIRKTFFWSYMLHGMVLFFHTSVIRVAQPVMLSIFIGLFSETAEDTSNDNTNEMYLYGGLLILTSFIISVFFHHNNLQLSKIGMQVRIACCSLIYRKMLRLSKKSLGQSAAGQIVNLLSNDVSRFDLVSVLLHHLWIMPIQVVIVTYFIWREVEISSLIGVGTLFMLTIPVHAYVGKFTTVLRTKIAERTDTRVKIMAEIVSGIQVIKMYAWEKPFAKVANTTRIKEINILTWVSYVRGVILSSSVFIERSILFITVISYVLLGNVISADKVFSMAQFFNLLQLSMAIYYPMAVSMGAETLVSIKRLQTFMMLEESHTSVIAKTTSKSVLVKDVSASWVAESKILKNISIQIAPGTLCAIIGPVGAGKSSFLQLLLGELIPENGSIEVGGSISYSSQEPWLFASTVRKNILFGQSYDQELYRKVVKVCALERDFELLPRGDKTMVGERGVSLSGGQKARINLARAVYRNADIFLLDDPLSAVDTHVGKHLFDECIVGYLKQKTRILVTHQLQYLKKADHIVVINDGKIEAQGSFAELSDSKLDFTKMLLAADESDAEKETLKPKVSLIRRESVLSSLSVLSVKSESVDVVQNEENEEGISRMGASAYWQYARAGGNVCVLLGLLIVLASGQVASNGADLWLTYWVNQEALRNSTCSSSPNTFVQVELLNKTTEVDKNTYLYEMPNNDELFRAADDCESLISTNSAIYIYTGIIVASIVFLTARSLYYFKVAMTASKNLHNKMFRSLLQAPMRFFDTNPSGRILNRFSRDIGMIDEILPRFMLEALQIFLVMIGILVMVAITNVYMIAIAVVLGVLFYKIRGWYIANAKDIKHLEGTTKSPVFSHLNASLNGITTIRASLAEPLVIQEFDWHQDTHTSAWYIMLVCMSTFGFWLDLLSIIFLACVVFGFILMSQSGAVTGSMVGLAVSQSMILIGMVQYGIRQTAEVVSQMTSVERVLEYTELEKEGPQETPKENMPPENWPHAGAVIFNNVNLKYSQSEPPVLRDLSFAVKAGEKVGIVGRTGAGKSSLIAALFRLTPLEGKITIDAIDTQTIGLNDMRKKISIIPQEPVLFSATLRYNLDPFDEFSDIELWNALEEVELKDISPSLDFFVQEGGSNFSVGQRQLLCLARAILRNNKILVLDEATANVDPQTDALIQKTIRSKFNACTVLTVAHRLHTIIDSDKVLVMDAGTLVEYDHPHQLLQNTRGFLYKMVAQTGPSMTAQLHTAAENTYIKTIQEEEEEKNI